MCPALTVFLVGLGMAFVAGAGSIITLLGAARGAVAIGFFYEIEQRQIDFSHRRTLLGSQVPLLPITLSIIC